MRFPKLAVMPLLLVWCCGNCVGQDSSRDLILTPPLPPFIAQFEFWAQQLVQWPAAPFPISSIEVSVSPDSTGQNLYDIVLEDRVTHRRSHYLSDHSLVSKIHDGESYLSPISIRRTSETPSAYEFSFTDHEGHPVSWRFVPGSDVSERGAGLTQIAQGDPHAQLMLMYREQGASAGPGTTLRVGKDVALAEVWKEISVPPFFTAYKGALTVGADVGVFVPGEVEWHVDSQPRSLTAGESWKMTSKENWKGVGETRGGSVSISAVSAEGYTFLFESESFGRCRINADVFEGKWRIRSVTYGDSDHGLTVAFQPGLVTSHTAHEQHPTFEIRMARNRLVAEGAVAVSSAVALSSGGAGSVEMEWQFENPRWARSQKLAQKIGSAPGTVFIQEVVTKRKVEIAAAPLDTTFHPAPLQ